MIKETLALAEYYENQAGIPKETVLTIIEKVFMTTIPKSIKISTGKVVDEVEVELNRRTGELSVKVDGEDFDLKKLSRIGTQLTRNMLVETLQAKEADFLYEKI